MFLWGVPFLMETEGGTANNLFFYIHILSLLPINLLVLTFSCCEVVVSNPCFLVAALPAGGLLICILKIRIRPPAKGGCCATPAQPGRLRSGVQTPRETRPENRNRTIIYQ